MKIKKIGHCCLVIEEAGIKILTDPGSFSTAQDEEENIDLVLITHEHGDHLHVVSLKNILKKNPQACVVTNSAVGKILEKEGIKFTLLEGEAGMTYKDVEIEARDGKHEEIFEEYGQVQNTGYMVGGKLFYPGDSFHLPGKEVEILALPVAGPWCKIGDAIRYTQKVKPKSAFPVHDAVINEAFINFLHKIPQMILEQENIKFISLKSGETMEF